MRRSASFENQEFKEKLNYLFKTLRKQKVTALQNFSCCGSCGSSELSDKIASTVTHKRKEIKGYAFYHHQDVDSLSDKYPGVYIRYCGGKEFKGAADISSVQLGNLIKKTAENMGLYVEWDGDADQCIWIYEDRYTHVIATKSVAKKVVAYSGRKFQSEHDAEEYIKWDTYSLNDKERAKLFIGIL